MASNYTIEDMKEAKRINQVYDLIKNNKNLLLGGEKISHVTYHKYLKTQMLKNNPQLKNDIKTLEKNGYIILSNLLTKNELKKIYSTSRNLLANIPYGRNDFEGYKTKRTNSLLKKSRVYDKMLLNTRIEAICSYYLLPNYLVSSTQLIQIFPGETQQSFHMDSGSYGYSYAHLPRNNPLQISLVWALDDFTDKNGATLIIPKSHLWNEKRTINIKKDKIISATMKAGECVLYFGTLYHGGGINKSDSPRLGLTFQFVQPWIRTQENHFLTIPFDYIINNKIPKKIQKMIGYSIHSPNYGMADAIHPIKVLPDLMERYSKL
eukprot:402805_1